MAAIPSTLSKLLLEVNKSRFRNILQRQPLYHHNVRHNHFFKHLAKEKNHDNKYEYEVSKDPKEWAFVERLLPFETVPVPTPKESYPSGWRPPSEEALKHPYYVERTKNHMLPVYLRLLKNGRQRLTILRNIHGDLWLLHDELKEHLAENVPIKIFSQVQEGNKLINFKGDLVYHIEQWLLNKGF